MFSFSAVVIALLLIPTFMCSFILHLFFPRNTLKVSETHLVPLGLGVTLLFNTNRIFRFAELLSPPMCFREGCTEQAFIDNLAMRSHEIRYLYLDFVFVPVASFTVIVVCLYFVWRRWIIYPRCNSLFREIAKVVNANLVNYMGNLTAYAPTKKVILVDVLDANDSLYSGIFMDYFMEDKKLVGIQVANVIRYSFKSETDRKDNGETVSQPSVTDSTTRPYILPNHGNMFFPVENIQNLHFWSMSKDHEERIHIDRTERQIRFAWLIGLSYSLPHLKFNIKGFLIDNELDVDLTPLRKAFNTLRLQEDYLYNNIEFIPPDVENA